MRILHTSDWHLGRQFHGLSLDEDHDHILVQILAVIDDERPDVVIIAGDVFDRANPPQSAITRLSQFLTTVRAASDAAIVIIAGNHDSAAQIGAMGVLADGGAAIVRGPLDEDERPLVVSDAHGPVAISALPFAFEYAARLCFDDDGIGCPADVIRAQLASARKHVAEGMRWVVVAHAFVDGAATSESERPLTRMVGGIETVSAAAFEGAHYVALGHLHRPQPVGLDHIRYSGAPLAFGFDEEGQQKSVSLIDLAADGTVTVTEVPLRPLRQVRTIRGKLLELLAAAEVSNDIVRVVLTDDTPQIDPMKRIRAVYPNAVQLAYERNERPVELRLEEQRAAIDDPQTLSSAFLEFIRGEPLSDAEGQIVASALQSFATMEEEA
ncbi:MULTISPECIES: exonuclease SbcCD subunit D [Sphingomonadales]|jgi:exonuclease SbcD|uniref:Nuclease SbcCD subunit D n=1 Tax=Novosphingobium subterraneum TaxID=48936 RepID=A0A0B8ZSG2_9SPHN|nr:MULTISPECIES: exonuclease SbcCD subunit D [Sphingomonadales]KHS49431.1 nuclease SbcCD subunit D [Novosphingobium subterraneum]KHS49653.1 nuclease SbcCD subunit D [Novosphingobium subterraneum]QXF14267.1 exonuclease SbcCD subunit D [Sphingopyxis terrae subsp. terrae]